MSEILTVTRRGFLGSVLALAAAPAIVRLDSLMKLAVPTREILIPETAIVEGLVPDGLPPGFKFRWDPFLRMFSVVDKRGDYEDDPITPEMERRIAAALKMHNQEHLAHALVYEKVPQRTKRGRPIA